MTGLPTAGHYGAGPRVVAARPVAPGHCRKRRGPQAGRVGPYRAIPIHRMPLVTATPGIGRLSRIASHAEWREGKFEDDENGKKSDWSGGDGAAPARA
jgi:hypothetical protein